LASSTGPNSESSRQISAGILCESSPEVGNHNIRRLALVVEYDGTNYRGFQLQSAHPTIQGEIESGLAKFTGERIRVRGASRTDSGAHASGQVVDFLTASGHSLEIFPKALNYYLPQDIKVQSACQVPLDFNSRRSATSRTYRYNILVAPWPSPLRRTTHYWVRQELRVADMAQAARSLVGVHDFRALAPGHPIDKSAVRIAYRWDVWQEADTVIIECEANGFLRHQIRKVNSILVQVGLGNYPESLCPESVVSECLKGEPASRVKAPILPPHGLCLMQVKYPTLMNKDGPGDSEGTEEGKPPLRQPIPTVAATEAQLRSRSGPSNTAQIISL